MTKPGFAKNNPATSGLLARIIARDIAGAFSVYHTEFARISRRAATRFAARDFTGKQRDRSERIDLYEPALQTCLDEICLKLDHHALDIDLWRAIKGRYARLIRPIPDRELYKTFYNSVTRRLFNTIGTRPEIEFVEPPPPYHAPAGAYVFHGELDISPDWLIELFRHLPLPAPLYSPVTEARFVARELTHQWGDFLDGHPPIESLPELCYRNLRSYIVLRAAHAGGYRPLVLALINTSRGIRVEAVVTDPREISALFGYTRSYFHADLDPVADAVDFISSILPAKPRFELYTSLGRAKQGKTERYRELIAALSRTQGTIVDAATEPGMVMVVFSSPEYPAVFKVLRDRFGPAKSITHEGVVKKYAYVFKHDRAGRLIDAQEFRELILPRHAFAASLLEDLAGSISQRIDIRGNEVVLHHVYVERRVRPLNAFLPQADPRARRAAVHDFGQTIKDLAGTGLFPGDLFPKNFGLTPHGRVVLFDYDDVVPLGECRFRALPKARYPEEALAAEPWFSVEPGDVFPEEFSRFWGLDHEASSWLLEAHGELTDPCWWRAIQAHTAKGEINDTVPYPRRRRLRPPVLVADITARSPAPGHRSSITAPKSS